MKVIHISCVAPPETGGIGQAASDMVKRLRGRGVDATLVSRKLRRKLVEPDPEWVTRLPAPIRFGNAGILAGIESKIRGADVGHLHYPFFGTAEGVALACLMRKKPLVMTFYIVSTAKCRLGWTMISFLPETVPGSRFPVPESLDSSGGWIRRMRFRVFPSC